MPTMPNVVGVEYQDALTAMQNAGVRVLPLGYFQADPVTLTWIKNAAKPSFVTAQSVANGAVIAANSPVNLTVSIPPVSVANFGGLGS
jgi:beta-lactam-binding protein with PASTA domain